MSSITIEEELRSLNKIEQILFPNGITTVNQRNGAEIVFNAAKYIRSLITTDGGSRSQPGGILGNRAKLSAIGAKILTPAEGSRKLNRR
jgi:hypothetical protein